MRVQQYSCGAVQKAELALRRLDLTDAVLNKKYAVAYNAGGSPEAHTNQTPYYDFIVNEYSKDDPDRLKSMTVTERDSSVKYPIAYDACGNPTSYKGAALAWVRGSTLSSFTNAQGKKVSYFYNASGMRTKIVSEISGETTQFLLDGEKILGELRDNVKLQYLYDQSGLCGIIAIENSGSENFYHVIKSIDGSVTEILNLNEVVAKFYYDAFGNQTIYIRPNSGFKAEYCPFRFRGHYYDTDTGLYYIDKKYYDSTNSLFVTPCNFSEL